MNEQDYTDENAPQAPIKGEEQDAPQEEWIFLT